MRYRLIALLMLLFSVMPAAAQVSINFSSPGVSVGINLPVYPVLERVPGYPVYYAPNVSANYFFYDGLYWIYFDDNWYASAWYNGPWRLVDPIYVPLYVLRVPVRYYRRAPLYFRGWRPYDPPRWNEHWGHTWEQRRSGWNQWDRNAAPAPAPLPTYQRQYSGSRYPQPAQQAALQTQTYRYQPRDSVAQEVFQHQRAQAQAVQPRQATPPPQPTRQAPVPRQQSSQQQLQQQAPQPATQHAEQRRQVPAVREQPLPRVQPQRVERPSSQAPIAHEQPQHQQAPEHSPPGREQGRGQDNNKGKDKDRDDKEPKERGRDR